jgi:hypothetical protein
MPIPAFQPIMRPLVEAHTDGKEHMNRQTSMLRRNGGGVGTPLFCALFFVSMGIGASQGFASVAR